MKVQARVQPFAVWRDVAIGAAGTIAMGALLAGIRPAPLVAVLMGTVLALFAFLCVRALVRKGRRITLADGILTVEDMLGRRRLDLADIASFRLDYYPGMLDRRRGLFVLRLGSRRERLSIDSETGDFSILVAQARAMARRAAVPLSERTRVNLQALDSAPDRSP
ncbi:MAG: hypothetical protein LPL00_03680 [Alphaproteobacteria bacterium]|nr:hypothetical protein [Alphaproteobacteria bacterium]MDX5368593.1 hypothetical protein [Alphaproteobacteria bacterium]MDX5463338.1 hypothetical protein [Alphaproteobacteria bacterium]